MVKRSAMAIALLVCLLPAGAVADHGVPENCDDRATPAFAIFRKPSGGSIQVQTGPTGALLVPTTHPAPGVVISTTGQVTVEVETACVRAYTVTVQKSGSPTPVYTRTWAPECEHTVTTDEATIGLDAGEYTFTLDGVTCSGRPLRRGGDGTYVADPPL